MPTVAYRGPWNRSGPNIHSVVENLEDVFVRVELVDPIEPDSPGMRRDLRVIGEELSSRLDGFVGVLVDDGVDICRVGVVFESFFLVYPSARGGRD